MAVTREQSQTNIQSLVDQGVPTSLITGYGNKLNPGEAQKILQKFQANPQEVLSAGNIQSTVTAPAVRPDDLLGIRGQIRTELGLDKLSQEALAAEEAARKAELGLQERLTGLQGRPVSISKIVGTQAQEREVSSNEINTLQEAARAARARYTAGEMEADTQLGIREKDVDFKRGIILQYPGAGITFGDSTENIASKLNKFQVSEEKRLREQAKNDAFDQLYFETFGTDRGNKSRKEAKKQLKKRFDSEKEYNDKLKDLEMQKAELGIEALKIDIKKSLSGAGGKFTEPVKGEVIQAINTRFASINPDTQKPYTWQDIANELSLQGVDVSRGSAADTELRRLHGLPPVSKLEKGADSLAEQIESLNLGE